MVTRADIGHALGVLSVLIGIGFFFLYWPALGNLGKNPYLLSIGMPMIFCIAAIAATLAGVLASKWWLLALILPVVDTLTLAVMRAVG